MEFEVCGLIVHVTNRCCNWDNPSCMYAVRSCFGPRFQDWQLAQIAEENFRKYSLEDRDLLDETVYRELLAEIENGQSKRIVWRSGAGDWAMTKRACASTNGDEDFLFGMRWPSCADLDHSF